MKFLKATTDIAFKKLFGTPERSNLTISFLNGILERKNGNLITELIINDPANHPSTIDQKLSFVDVSCTDQRGKKYIIEMQVINKFDFLERSQYYAAHGISRQLSKGDRYYPNLTPVIFVGVVCFDLFESQQYIHHHVLKEDTTGERKLNLCEYYFIELSKFEKSIDQVSTIIDKWIYLIKNADDMEEIPLALRNTTALDDACHVLEQGAWSSEEYGKYEAEVDKWRSDQNALYVSRQEGRQEGLEATARSMLIEGIDIALIAKVTGLTEEQVKDLRSKP